MSDKLIVPFTKTPGGLAHNEELGMTLIGNYTPEWVKVPDNLGGGRANVVRTFTAPCPVHGNPCRHHELDNGLFVAESDDGFNWYKPRTGEGK